MFVCLHAYYAFLNGWTDFDEICFMYSSGALNDLDF